MAKPLVLLIDDDPDVRALLGLALGMLYRVEFAADGPTGLAKARALRPAVIVTDMGLPGMNGLQISSAVKDDPDLRDTPVVLITGATKGEDLPDGFWRIGTRADEFLQKPFSPNALTAKVQSLLERRAGARPLAAGTGSYDTATGKAPLLVTDFDGTLTQTEFYQVAVEDLVAEDVSRFWDDYVGGRLSHFDALHEIFARIRGTEETILARARERMGPASSAVEALRRLRSAGWEMQVVSAGCAWYIERLLDAHGVLGEVQVFANPGVLRRDGALLMQRPPADFPHADANLGVSKASVVRTALRERDRIAFAGDGRPDLEAALLVPPERRFATGWLADHLAQKSLPFRRFARWEEVADALLAP
jgi:2,3-diketo-5-methylthio-1-phosphopentane phosphatase